MKELANTIYWFGCVVAATVLGIGVVDYWFNDHKLTALLSWAGIGGPSLARRSRISVRRPDGLQSSDTVTRPIPSKPIAWAAAGDRSISLP
jgi:hypothetical protein